MADNAAGIIAIELLAAAQGLDFHRPLRSSTGARGRAPAAAPERADAVARDRFFAPDIAAARKLVVSGALREHVASSLFAR